MLPPLMIVTLIAGLLKGANGYGALRNPVGLTFEQQAALVRYHNVRRASESAADMQEIVFDQNLADLAQDWANKCTLMHRPNNRYGENIALYGWFFQFAKLALPDNVIDFSAELWYNQKYQYQYQLRPLGPGSDHRTIHYTQMVSSNICAMGCGAALCDALEGYGGRSGWSIVCNYNPPGNMMGKTPYEYGATCSRCPLGPNTCTSYGLCQGQCAGVRIPPDVPYPPPPPPPPPSTDTPAAPPKAETTDSPLSRFGPDIARQASQAIAFAAPGYPKPPQKLDDCMDSGPLCPYWASQEKCHTEWNWMSTQCKGSCSAVCLGSAGIPSTSCVDVDADCSTWAADGDCQKNAFYMQWRCPKSCRLCSRS